MAISYPTTSLEPGATGTAVKQLQDYLVSKGYMTQAQVATGSGDSCYVYKAGPYNMFNMVQEADSSTACIGMKMDITNVGTGVEAAFGFYGDETFTITGITDLSKALRVLVDGSVYYIPIYATTS